MTTSWTDDADRTQDWRDQTGGDWIETALVLALLLVSAVVLGACIYLGTCQ